MHTCPSCKSTRVARVRLDSAWGYGGNWGPANMDAQFNPAAAAGYTEDDKQDFDNNERPDIECLVCCACLTRFEPVKDTAPC